MHLMEGKYKGFISHATSEKTEKEMDHLVKYH